MLPAISHSNVKYAKKREGVQTKTKTTIKWKLQSKKQTTYLKDLESNGNCELHLSDVKSEWQWSDSRIGLKNVAHLSGLIGRCPDKMCDKLYME